MKYYVGLTGKHRMVFRSSVTPTQATHGKKYRAVIGPFRTKRAAMMMATFGSGNPHLQSVLDAEKLASKAVQQ